MFSSLFRTGMLTPCLIQLNKIEKAITTKTKVILPVHWGGASPEISRILKIAKKYNIKVVEDA